MVNKGYTYRHALHPRKELSMKTEKQRKLIVRIGAAILAGLMILSALSAVQFSYINSTVNTFNR